MGFSHFNSTSLQWWYWKIYTQGVPQGYPKYWLQERGEQACERIQDYVAYGEQCEGFVQVDVSFFLCLFTSLADYLPDNFRNNIFFSTLLSLLFV